ncbi:MAG TPA: S-adenosylmethionine-binding protein, partial [Candidatus Edwardsbacteria bacterium]|nr:S-adenosylmethionine-binding protein [Candidatus Edwardsbacteria bacterium]
SPGPYLELFARGKRNGWCVFGDQSENYYPDWETYKNHSQTDQLVIAREKRKKLKLKK